MPNYIDVRPTQDPMARLAEIERTTASTQVAMNLLNNINPNTGASLNDVTNFFAHPYNENFQVGYNENGTFTGEYIPGTAAQQTPGQPSSIPPGISSLLSQLSGARTDPPGYSTNSMQSGFRRPARPGNFVPSTPDRQQGEYLADMILRERALTEASQLREARAPRSGSMGVARPNLMRQPVHTGNQNAHYSTQPAPNQDQRMSELEELLRAQAETALARDQLVRTPNDVAQGLFEQLLSQGGTQQAQANSDRRGQGSDALLSTTAALQNLINNPIDNNIMQGIERQFRENVFSQLGRQAEGAGSSASALRALLENDANTRLQESQANTALSTVINAAGQQSNVASALNQLTATDPVSQELIALLAQSGQFQGFDNIHNLIDVVGPTGLGSSSSSSRSRRRNSSSLG